MLRVEYLTNRLAERPLHWAAIKPELNGNIVLNENETVTRTDS